MMRFLVLVAAFVLVQSVPAVVSYVDVIGRSGIQFRHENSPTPDKYLVETMGSGGAFIDYDSDGFLDIFLINGGWVPGTSKTRNLNHALYRNKQDGTFEDVTARARIEPNTAFGMGAAVENYDNDGKADRYITNVNGQNTLYHNSGNRNF